MRTFIVILISLFSFSIHASNEDTLTLSLNDAGDDIASAIREGDASKLAAFFASTIELSVPGKKGSYSKTQAEMIMREFFETYPPTSFTITAEGKSAAYSLYAIGSYVSDAKTFKTYYLIRRADTGFTLHILKFEEK
ncbi:MAG: hypothetical protein C0592_00610 [Marinilabiliales bacterium]|nr:MAG: hypothetical protein C0592_00610 [Marinilabiliales bacterium]